MNIFTEFHKQDFILLRNELNENEVTCLENEYHRLITVSKKILNDTQEKKITLEKFYKKHADQLIVVPEISDDLTPCRFEYIAHCSEVINQTIIKKIERRINGFMGEPFVLFKDKCNVKNPGGGAFPPHQDISAYHHFGPQFHVTAAVMLDDSTIENGCLEVAVDYKNTFSSNHFNYVENSFGKFPFFDFYQGGKNNGDIKNEISDQLNWKPIEAKKGDVLLFNSYLPHCSKKNISNHPRRNFFFTYNALSAGNWYQQYYDLKKNQFDNPMFHVSTPTQHAQYHDK